MSSRRTSMKNSESTRGVMCSRCQIEVTNCDESMLSQSLLCEDKDRTFLKEPFQDIKFATMCVYLALYEIQIYIHVALIFTY